MWVIVTEELTDGRKQFKVGHYLPAGPHAPASFVKLVTYENMISAVRLVNVLNGGDGDVPNATNLLP